ncbi:unnamed protein product, partial [Candidula unifasciata]
FFNSFYCFSSIDTHRILIPTIWGLISFVGAVGNIIVIFTMGIRRRSATNCYIINVALADLAFILFVVPITTAAYASNNWEYGTVMCKVNFYIIYATLLSTCLTLTAMTIDRYYAIVHPIRSLSRRTPKSTLVICIAIWLASMIVSSPYLMVQEVRHIPKENSTVCMAQWPDEWEKVVIIVVVMVTYVIPLCVIIISYTLILKFLWRHRIGIRREFNHNSQSSEPVMGGESTIAERRKKVAKMVAAVVILFALSWLPIHVFNLCFILMPNFPKSQIICVNPFVYTIMGDSFRKAFRESLPWCRNSPSNSLRTSYSRRTGSTTETRFNGE